jgi:cathepsin D
MFSPPFNSQFAAKSTSCSMSSYTKSWNRASVSLTFGGKMFAISAATFCLGRVSAGSSQCVGGIVGEDIGADFWIVGDVFMRNVYTKFDLGKSEVAFAQLA